MDLSSANPDVRHAACIAIENLCSGRFHRSVSFSEWFLDNYEVLIQDWKPLVDHFNSNRSLLDVWRCLCFAHYQSKDRAKVTRGIAFVLHSIQSPDEVLTAMNSLVSPIVNNLAKYSTPDRIVCLSIFILVDCIG